MALLHSILHYLRIPTEGAEQSGTRQSRTANMDFYPITTSRGKIIGGGTGVSLD